MTNLLNSLCLGAALTALIWILLKLFPRFSAATRYGIWWLTLLAVVLLPLRTLLPDWNSEPSRDVASSKPLPQITLVAPVQSEPRKSLLVIEQPLPNLQPVTSGEKSTSPSLFPFQLPSRPIVRTVGAIWITLWLVFLIRLIVSYRTLRRLKQTAIESPDSLRARFTRIAESVQLNRSVRLLISHEITAPLALGFLDPAILIPPTLADESSPQEFDHIILHELAHLLRFDDWTNLLQQLLIALFPIQPALFWISRNLDMEREAACDDRVIAGGASPKPYATSLTKIAELAFFSRHGVLTNAALASGVVSSRSQLYRRINRLLDSRANKKPGMSAVAALATMIAIVFVFSFAQNVPPLIALADTVPAAAQSPQSSNSINMIAKEPDMPATTLPATSGTQTHSIPAQPGEKLTLDLDLGNVQINSWDQNQVQFKITQNGPDIDKFLQHHQISIGRRDHEVSLRAVGDNSASRNVDIEYEILIPRKFDVRLENPAGNARLSNLNGTISAKINAGNIEATTCAGSFEAIVDAGNITLHGMTATANARTTDGNIEAAECLSPLNLTTENGNVDFAKISADVQAKSTSGNVDATAVSGSIHATSKAGNIELHKFTGPYLTADASMGNVSAEIDASPKADCSLRANMGNVAIKLIATAAVNLEMAARMGNVDSEIPAGPLNGGGPEIDVSSQMGNISIHKK